MTTFFRVRPRRVHGSIAELGIRDPKDLDIEAIAFAAGSMIPRKISSPAVLAYSAVKKLWQVCAPHVRRRWQIKDSLDADSFAYDLLRTGSPCPAPRKQSAAVRMIEHE